MNRQSTYLKIWFKWRINSVQTLPLDWSVSVSGNSLMCINQHILPSLWQIHRYSVLVSVYYCTWHKVMEWMIYTWIRYKSTGCGHTSADTRIILRNQSLQSSTPKSIKQLKDLCIKVKCKMYSDECPAMTNVYLKSEWNWCNVWSL